MPDIVLNNIVSSTGPTGNFLAETIQANFDAMLAVLNNHGLDDVNYGALSFDSEHIAPNAVITNKISNLAVVEAKVADEAVLQYNMLNGNTLTLEGVRIVQASPGIRAVRCVTTFTLAAVSDNRVFSGLFSDMAQDGDPLFTETPFVIGMVETGNATASANDLQTISILSVNSVMVEFTVERISGANTADVTMEFWAVGK